MKIHALIWPQDCVEHIAQHNVLPEEVEEVCFGQAQVQRAKPSGKTQSIMYLGRQSRDGTDFVSSYIFLMAGDIR